MSLPLSAIAIAGNQWSDPGSGPHITDDAASTTDMDLTTIHGVIKVEPPDPMEPIHPPEPTITATNADDPKVAAPAAFAADSLATDSKLAARPFVHSHRIPDSVNDTKTAVPSTALPQIDLKPTETGVFVSAPKLIPDALNETTPAEISIKDEPLDVTDTTLPQGPEASLEDSPPPEFCEAYESLENSKLVPGLTNNQSLPRTPSEFNKFRCKEFQSFPPYRMIAVYVSRLKRHGELNLENQQVVHDILKSLYKMEGLTPEIWESCRCKFILEAIAGELADQAGKPYAFPPILAEQASIVLEHFQDSLNLDDDLDLSPTPPPTPPLPTAGITSNRRSTSEKPTSRKRKAKDISTDSPQQRPFPDLENPTIKAIMHNIHLAEAVRVGSRRTYKITNISQRRDYNQYGHNGLRIGQWWPYRMCALRDGAHGSTMGGIAGGATDGAKSIVVGGGYEGMDKDEGDVIYYSGSNSQANKDPNTPHISNGTKSLQRAMMDKRLIRVLRSATKGVSQYAPAVGFRYDGLYKIVDQETRLNENGGAYLRFKFVRQPGQDETDFSRPNEQERKAFATLKRNV